MKHLHFIGICFLFLFASCAEQDDHNSANSGEVSNGVICTVRPFEYEEDVQTRSSLSFNLSTGFKFSWSDGDKITVYSDNANKGDFTLAVNNGSSATFTGGGFQLIDGSRYYSFSKSTNVCVDKQGTEWHNAPSSLDADVLTNIKVSYCGQRMTSNGNDAHLGQYDYMAATATAQGTNYARFDFQHLGINLCCRISGLPAGVHFTKITMYDASEDAYRGFDRTIDLTKGLSANSYSPAWNTYTLTSEHERFSMDLGPESGDGISVASSSDILDVFMVLPPFDFTNKTIAFRLTPKEENVKSYFCLAKGTKPYVAGRSYLLNMIAEECTQYKIYISVVHDWIKGDVVSQTRAGDPGVTDEFELPTHLYAFFVNNGKLVQQATVTLDNPQNYWTTSDGVSMLKEDTQWSITGESGTTSGTLTLSNSYKNNPRVYVIASNSKITFDKVFAFGTDNGTPEADIQALTYAYSSQSQVKNLYSTPWNASWQTTEQQKLFSGELMDDVKDVRLYHVASKVDVNWESASKLSGNVSVQNFPTTGLSFFKPTTGNSTTGDESESVSITEGSAYNGRTVFYIPQPSSATYNITVGSKTQDVTFTRDDVYTSWFRGLITE